MKSTKKTLAKVFACVMAFGLTFAAVGCGGGGSKSEAKKEKDFISEIGGTSETYTGAVSAEIYETATAAATAYVTEEIVGEKEADIVATETKATFEGEQIATLNIPADITAGAQSIEEIEVEYSVSDAEGYMAAVSNSTKKVKVYVIKYETNWKYYTPLPETGATISKSYYDSVFNYEKYKNCTFAMDMEMDMNVKASAGGYTQTATIEVSMSQFVQYSENAIYIEQTASFGGMEDITGGEVKDESMTIAAYMEKTAEGDIICYVKSSDIGSGWSEGDLTTVGFSSLTELTPFYDQYLDFTYFTKTETGFQLADENSEKFIELTLKQDESMGELIAMFGEDFDMDMFVKYYVSNGVLSGMRQELTMDAKMTEEGVSMKLSADVVTKMTCTNYGTTVVKKPAGIN
ncbi:MAG: hypothetical protein IJD77_08280 [Clostridia bacterium]|nr:hypothetical protein [Clostridia bacterium]